MSEELQKKKEHKGIVGGFLAGEVVSFVFSKILENIWQAPLFPFLTMIVYCITVFCLIGKQQNSRLLVCKIRIVILGFPIVVILLLFWAIQCFLIDFNLIKNWIRILNGTAIIYIVFSLFVGICIHIYNTIFQSCNTICKSTDKIEKNCNTIYELAKKVEKNTSKAFVYATTCILVRRNPINEKELLFCLINNEEKNKEEPPWMFPGGHIKVIEDSALLDKLSDSEFKMINLDYAPAKSVIEQCKKETGIKEVKLISPFQCTSYDTYASDFATCETPVFNYLIRMASEAKCYKENGHRVHFHFTYVGQYDAEPNGETAFPVLEIPICIDIAKEGLGEATHRIADLLVRKINDRNKSNSKNYTEKGENELFYRHIPLLIYNTLCFYKENTSKF